MSKREVVVVGAGPAGLSAAVALKDAGVRPLLVDRAERVASSWRHRYDRLRLNTCRPLSHLPGRPFRNGTPMFPSRDQLVDHLEHHANEDGIDLRLGTSVERVDPDGDGWRLETSAGEIHAHRVIVATGYEHTPVVPEWPGRVSFGGRLLHAGEYRNATPFQNQRVLVVGPGCSGMEIAFDLAEGGAARVWLSARTPPNILLRTGPGGLPGDVMGVALLHVPARFADAFARLGRRMDLGDLTDYGLPVPEEGPMSRLRRLGAAPTIVDKEVIEAVKAGRIEVVGGVESLDAVGVRLADGGRIEPDVVVCATGYGRALESLVGHLGVLDERGLPHELGSNPAAPGLHFIGFVPRPGVISYMGREAQRTAKAIARELRRDADARKRNRRVPAAES